jgi:hypothetical protein
MLLDSYFTKLANQDKALKKRQKPALSAPKAHFSPKSRFGPRNNQKPCLVYRHLEGGPRRGPERELSPAPIRRVRMLLDEYFDGFPLEKKASRPFFGISTFAAKRALI